MSWRQNLGTIGFIMVIGTFIAFFFVKTEKSMRIVEVIAGIGFLFIALSYLIPPPKKATGLFDVF